MFGHVYTYSCILVWFLVIYFLPCDVFFRSNIIKYLEDNLTHSSEQIRSLSLEMLCCTVPRLGNKTDSLLKPLLPKVFLCLRKDESKELKTKALHFLRGYFQHTRRLSGYSIIKHNNIRTF